MPTRNVASCCDRTAPRSDLRAFIDQKVGDAAADTEVAFIVHRNVSGAIDAD